MVFFVDNEEASRLLPIEECIRAIERAYRDWDERAAAIRPKTQLYVVDHYQRSRHNFVTMEGAWPSEGVVALRIRSDVSGFANSESAEQKHEPERIEKRGGAEGMYCGLVLWFDSRSGAPLGIANDGYLQHARVGAVAAVAARYLAQEGAKTLGILGSSWMARSHLLALSAVRPIESIRVFSPNPENRAKFAMNMSQQTGLEIDAVPTAEEAVRDADIVATCTNSRLPVLSAEWLDQGCHISCVLPSEIGDDVLARITRTVRHQLPPTDRVVYGVGETEGEFEGWQRTYAPDDATILDLLSGRSQGRADPAEITFFTNNEGNGLQFAALGSAMMQRIEEQGYEPVRRLPLDWFLQEIST